VSRRRRGSSVTMVVDSVNLAKHNNKKMNFVSKPKPTPKNEEKGKGVARPPTKKQVVL
jgi:hypothetical protein